MENRSKSMLAILLGILIIVADIYWIYINPQEIVLGAIIFLASVIWIVLDYMLMRKSKMKNVILLSQLTILMGIIVAIADVYWSYRNIGYPIGVELGVVIFVLNSAWLYLEYDLMKGGKATMMALATLVFVIIASIGIGGLL